MNGIGESHPSGSTLLEFARGRLDELLTHTVRAHLVDCSECRQRFATLKGDGDTPTATSPVASGSPRPTGSSLEGLTDMRRSADSSVGPLDDLPRGLADHPDYRVLKELGRGGMGVVYLAENRLMGRKEVLKVVSRNLVERKKVLERFLREIRSAAQLNHPNVVTAYTAFRVGEQLVLAMEFVEGLDLSSLVKSRGPLPVPHACNFAHQAAMGLQHAHEAGMVHRDVKPGNLMLTRQGSKALVKILDFGLSKAVSEIDSDCALTHEGQMLGTPDYIAPEQTLDAQSVDIRADVYSLGCTLYYLLSGGPPFRGSSQFDVLQKHHNQQAAPLNQVRPEVPPALALLVARMMAKSPGERFQTPGEVALALVPFFKADKATGLDTRRSSEPPPMTRPVAIAPPPPPQALSPGPLGTLHVDDQRVGSLDGSSDPSPRNGHRRRPIWLWPTAAAGFIVVGLIAWANRPGEGPLARKPGEPRRTPSVPIGPSVPPSSPPPVPPQAGTGEPPAEAAAEPGAPPRTPNPPTSRLVSPPRKRPPGPRPGSKGAARRPNRPREKRSMATDGDPASIVRAPEPVSAPTRSSVGPFPIRPVEFQPELEGKSRGPGSFWPELLVGRAEAWRTGDPASIKFTKEGLRLAEGPGGNFLMTRRTDYREASVDLAIKLEQGSEAFLVLRANPSPEGWRGLACRIHASEGKVLVAEARSDLTPRLDASPSQPREVGGFSLVKVSARQKGAIQILVNGRPVPSSNQPAGPAVSDKGAVGIFVKSGTVVIQSINIPDP